MLSPNERRLYLPYQVSVRYLDMARPEGTLRQAAHDLPGPQTGGTGFGDGDHEIGAYWRDRIQTMRSETHSRTLQEVANVASKFETRPGTAVVGWLGCGVKCERMGRYAVSGSSSDWQGRVRYIGYECEYISKSC